MIPNGTGVRWAALGVAASVLLGCETPPPARTEPDGGPDARVADSGDPVPTGASRLEVAFRADDDGEDTIGPIELDELWTLQALELSVAELRTHNDRGPGEQPLRSGIGTLDLLGAPRDVTFAAAPPATYAMLTLALGAEDGQPTLHLVLTEEDPADGERTFEIRTTAPLGASMRCEPGGALVLPPESSLRADVIVDALDLLERVFESDEPLPDPVDGVISIDAERAPGALEVIEARFAESLELLCERAAVPLETVR